MDYNRTGRPAAAPAPAPRPFDQPEQVPASGTGGGKNKKKRRFNVAKAGFMFVVVVATVVLLSILALIVTSKTSGIANEIQTDKYQAIFLNSQDGQVYFGKLSSLNAQYFKLIDIYYVRVENAVQPDKNAQAKQNISLAKLGNEIHGPQDVMYISKDHVLFWENLNNKECTGDTTKDKGCSQVYTAITKYKKDQASGTNTNQ